MEEKGVTVVSCDALELAREAGNIKSVNVALIGVMARRSSLAKEIWEGALEDAVPAKFLAVNQKAFELGYNHA